MDDRTKLVESLGKKIDRVLDDNRRLRSEALGLTTERDRLLRQKREAENRIRLLEKRIKTLETAGLRAVTIRYTPFPAKEVTFHH